MALNKKFVKMRKDKRAEMGVGTMIIFIAMVLVAAVAASVLIGTANQVREQAQSTGDQAINNVASGFIVQDVVGTVDTEDDGDGKYDKVETITLYLRLAAGSPRINMANVMITVVSGNVNQVMSMAASADGTHYEAERTQAADLSVPWSSSNYVVAQGDLIKVTIDIDKTASGGTAKIGFSQSGVIKIMPAYGQMNQVDFKTPESFSTGFVSLT